MAFDFSAAYDELNPADHDHRFYADLARDLGVADAVDLGCGTGVLARRWAATGIRAHGVDPDPAMIRVARERDPEGRVTWILGDSSALAPTATDLVVMSGHVAQVFREDDAWARTLADVHRALRPGGTLAFESRDPAARRWESWTRAETLRTVDTPEGPVEFWHETVEVALPLVAYDTFARNLTTGATTVDRDVLAFRDRTRLEQSLAAAGLEVRALHGDWDGRAVGTSTDELIFVTGRPAP